MTSKNKSSKKPITKLSDHSQSLVKQLWIPVAGIIGAIVLINQLIEIWTGNPTRTNYIIASVLLAIWLIVLVALTFRKTIREQKGFFSKKARLGKKNVPIYKLLSGVILLISIVCIIGGIVVFTRQKNEITRAEDEKIIILIANFDDGNDGKDLLDIHNSIVEQLRLSLAQYKDTDVITVDEVITVRQGSEYARELGQKHQADFVLWGRYRADIESPITIYIEYLSPSTFGVSKQSQTYKPTVSNSELKTVELRQNLGSSLSALINFLSGLAQYTAGNYTDAVSRFNQAINEPEWENAIISKSHSYFFIGTSYKALGRHDEAIEYLSYSIEFNPQFFLAYNERGHTFNHIQQFDKALADYNSAIELNPLSAGVYNNRGFLYDELGEYEKALQDYTKAIELNPLFAIAYYNRGSLYDTLKQYDKAIADYTRAIELDPYDFESYNNLGNDFYLLEKYDEAITNFNKAIEINPQYAIAYANRGATYFLVGQHDLGIDDFTRAIELEPNFAEAYYIRGLAFQAIGKQSEADNDFQKYNELTQQP